MYREFIFHQNIPTNVSPTIGIAHVGFGKISLVKLCEIHPKCASLKSLKDFSSSVMKLFHWFTLPPITNGSGRKIPLWRLKSSSRPPLFHFHDGRKGNTCPWNPTKHWPISVDPEERQEIVEAMDGKPLRLASIMIPIEIWTQKNGEFSNTQSQISEIQILLMVQKSCVHQLRLVDYPH